MADTSGVLGPTDPQIAAIVMSANDSEIAAAKYAKTESQNKDVVEFAKNMIQAHQQLNEKVSALLGKYDEKPESSGTSRQQIQDGKKALAKLKKLDVNSFDRKYADQAVSDHQAVLNALDKILIPNAKNEELKALLVDARGTVVKHLAHATQLDDAFKN
ncbi:unnamed protein product [Sphagnum jensenii]|uniref:DUF4142 domain-containing protein n=1 Tax=Sphagnum jensenii TaxID=128206 RepID=A0ABP0VIK7_9BRYO